MTAPDDPRALARDLVAARKEAKRIYDDWLSDRDFTESEILSVLTDVLRNFGDQRAAEASEAMRERCARKCDEVGYKFAAAGIRALSTAAGAKKEEEEG